MARGSAKKITPALTLKRAHTAYLRLLSRDERGREHPLVVLAQARREVERAQAVIEQLN